MMVDDRPILTTRILGTKYMYLLIFFQLLLYAGSIYIVISNKLLKLANLNPNDYFNSKTKETQLYFTSKEAKSVIQHNGQYVRDYLLPFPASGFTTYDEILKNSTLTTFYGVYRDQIAKGEVYDKIYPYDKLIENN